MKFFFQVLFFLLPFKVFSQALLLKSSVGFVTGETRDVKKIMLGTSFDMGWELKMKNNFSITAYLGGGSISYSRDLGPAEALFSKNFFQNTIVAVRKYFPVAKYKSLFIELGIINGFFVVRQNEIKTMAGEQIFRDRFIGNNTGLHAKLAYQFKISKEYDLEIGYSDQVDYFFHYRNDNDRLKNSKRLFIFTIRKNLSL